MTDDLQKHLKKISKLPDEIQQIVLAAFLAQLFRQKDVKLTLVGGAVVQFHTQAAYITKDVDAILHGDTTEIVEEVMHSIGFKRTKTYRHFEHPFFGFVVEFPPSPIEVGSRIISDLEIVETQEGPVRILRVEDIIMDRVIAAVEWKDPSSLKQAELLWIKNKNDIDRAYLTDFAKKEGCIETLREIMKL